MTNKMEIERVPLNKNWKDILELQYAKPTFKSNLEGKVTVYPIEYPSWDSYLEWVLKLKPVEGSRLSSIEARGEYWYGPDAGSWEETVNLGRYGWYKKADKFKKMVGPLVEKISNLIPRDEYFFDMEGVDFDVAKVIIGEPEQWLQHTTVLSPGKGRKIFKIITTISGNCHLSAEQLEWRGTAAMALAECLEIAGFGTEIVRACVDRSQEENYCYLGLTTVKRADETLDLPRLAFAIAHPASFRRLDFRIIESIPGLCESSCGWGGYGRAVDLPKEIIGGSDVIAIGYDDNIDQIDSQESAFNWVLAQLKAQGVDVDV